MSGSTAGRRAAVELVGIEKRYGPVQAVGPLDLRVEPGELMVLLGPSGCGKSTLLRMVAGITEPSRGDVRIGERSVLDLDPGERDIAMVFQSYALYPHMRVRDNLAFGLRMRGTDPTLVAAKVHAAAAQLELEGLLDRRPGELSGGQRQRVALGRALVRDPAVFLFDEPLSNLDARLRAEMRDRIAELHRTLGTTMLFVTHDQVEALSLGTRIAVLRQGRLHQVGAPLDIYRRPSDLFVARFVGTPALNVVEGTLVEGPAGPRFTGPDVQVALDAGSASARPPRVVLGARPEALRLVETDHAHAAYRGRVLRVEPLGSETLVHVSAPAGAPWIVRVPPSLAPRLDQQVGVSFDVAALLLFDAATGARLSGGAEAR